MDSAGITVNGFLRIRRYWAPPTNSFWDDIWEKTRFLEYWGRALGGMMDPELAKIVSRYCPARARISHYCNDIRTRNMIRPLYLFIEDTRRSRGLIDRALKLVLPRVWFGHMLMVIAEASGNDMRERHVPRL